MRLLESFRVLRHRHYRMYILAQMGGQPGIAIQQVGMGWLTYRLTESVFMLGLVAFASQIAVFFFGTLGGVMADRFDRGRLMIAVQVAFLAQALVLAALTFSGHVQPWSIVLIALVMGAISAVDAPTRQSFMVRLIDDVREMPSGIALGSMTFNFGRMVGPPIGGVLVAWAGEGACFAVVGITSLWSMVCFAMARKPGVVSGGRRSGSGIGAALTFVRGSRALRALLLMAASTSFFALSYPALLPYFAKDVYHGDANTLGFLLSCGGFGALAAALGVMTRRLHSLARFLAITVQVSGVALAIFPLMPAPWAAAPSLAMMGACMVVLGSVGSTLIQTMTPDEMRGRLMSLFVTATFGMIPLGSLFVSAIAEYISVPVTLVLCGLATALTGMVFLRSEAQVRAELNAPRDA